MFILDLVCYRTRLLAHQSSELCQTDVDAVRNMSSRDCWRETVMSPQGGDSSPNSALGALVPDLRTVAIGSSSLSKWSYLYITPHVRCNVVSSIKRVLQYYHNINSGIIIAYSLQHSSFNTVTLCELYIDRYCILTCQHWQWVFVCCRQTFSSCGAGTEASSATESIHKWRVQQQSPPAAITWCSNPSQWYR